MLGNWSTTCKRMELEHFLTPYTNINSKCIQYLNVKPETIKLLEENIGKTHFNINHSRILYDPPPRILEIKAKNKQMGPNSTWNLLHNKENYKQGEKTAFRMGENNSKWSNKGLISKIYKQLNSRKLNDPIKKWAMLFHFNVWQNPLQ